MPLTITVLIPGNFTVTDNGIPDDNTFLIKDASGNVVTSFVNPGDSLTLQFSGAGSNVTLDMGESLGATNFTVGNLASSGSTPDNVIVNQVTTTGNVTLVANQAISERGSDTSADIVAGSLVLSAGTGVGAGNAIETQTAALEAETTTGGITLTNFGTVQIGGVSDEVNGLDVATSGNLKLTAYGSILIGDTDLDTGNPPGSPIQSVHGGATSGNVTLTALGYSSDITANANLDAISDPGGNIVLNAGRDIAFGTVGSDYDNDVRAKGSITITAGRDFLIDGFSDLSSDDFGADSGGNLTVTAGRDIHLLDVAGNDASMGASGSGGGDVSLTTGAEGRVILDAPFTAAVFSNSGNVTIKADHMLIAASSGITAALGEVDLKTATDGRGFVLGSGTDSGVGVELSDAELDRIFAPTLVIGTTKTGPITTVGGISPANVQDVKLYSATDILLSNAMTILSDLVLRAGDNLILGSSSNVAAASVNAIVDYLQNDGAAGGVGQFLGTLSGSPVALSGGNEADYLQGADGIDQTVHGNSGNDTILSSGEGHYYGDAGSDTMFAGLSSGLAEVLDGGTGADTLDTTSYNGSYTVNMVTGVTNFSYESFVNFENLTTGGGNDILTGTSGNNIIVSGNGADTVNASGGNDNVTGGLGVDTLNGGAGNDTLNGGDDGDTLTGGTGKDVLIGGAGNDIFVFRDGDTAATRADADGINDFIQGQDTIRLLGVDANTTVGGDQAFTFIGAAGFSHTAGELHYVEGVANTYVEGDTNGDGVADVVIRVVGLIPMMATDFEL